MSILIWILQPIAIILLSPLLIGIIVKTKLKLQGLQGPPIFQNYRDLWKLFHKDEVISKDSSWIFKLTPYITFSITVVVSLLIPFILVDAPFVFLSDLLVIIYLLAFGTFFMALAGLDTGSPFGDIGSSREMTLSALCEAGIILSILPLVIISKSTNLFMIVSSILNVNAGLFLAIFVGFIAFVIPLLAENGRYPFDNPSTHLELTMIHEAMILEYSGKRLALMEWASFNKLMIFLIMGANLFFPFGISQTITLSALFISFVLLMVKLLILILLIAILESSIAKYRFFRLPQLLFSSIVFGIVAVLITL